MLALIKGYFVHQVERRHFFFSKNWQQLKNDPFTNLKI